MAKKKTKQNISDYILTDVEHLEGTSLHNGWIRIDILPSLFCKGNPKSHSIDKLWESIVRFGFVDPAKLDMNLTNVEGTKPALIFGNGRNEALFWGWQRWENGEHDIVPEGIRYDDEYWYVPVTLGIDAKSEAQAKDLLLFHNSSTMLGGSYQDSEIWRLYDRELLAELGKDIAENSGGEFEPLAMDGEELDDLIHFIQDNHIPNQEPPEEFPQYDSDIQTEYCCPKCKYEWSGKPK